MKTSKERTGCVHFPDRKSCRWCDYSGNPELYDGGCLIKEGERPGDKELERRISDYFANYNFNYMQR